MKITCGSCAAKYTVSDEKVQGKTVKVKCRKCGAVIVVSSTGEVQTTGGAGGASQAASAASYTVSISDTDQRTMTVAQIVDAYNEGVIDAETYLWAEGMDDWQPLKDVDAIVDALHEAAAGDAGDVSLHADQEDLSSTVAMDTSGGASSYGGYAAAPAGGADLGSTVAISDSSAFAASSSSSGSSSGSFFGGSGSSFGDVGSGGGLGTSSSSLGSNAGGTENSAIFSLNMLTAKATDKPSSSSTTEDSGLIDLKALAAGMGDSGGVAAAEPAPVADGGLFPLGAPPPQVPIAPQAMSMAPPQQSGSRGLIVGLVGAIVVLAAALVFFLVRGGTEPAPQPVATQAAPAPTPTPTPAATETAVPAAETTAAATAEASASASASAEQPKVAAQAPPRPVGRPAPRTGPQPAPRAKPAPRPKTGGCGCAADDLMCQMRCASK